MDRARTVLNLINLFDSTDREIIMENINYGMPDLAGWRMEQYRRIFAYTGKSKSFVLSWFNHATPATEQVQAEFDAEKERIL